MPLTPIQLRRLPQRWAALGVALHYLSGRQPFASFTAEKLIRTVDGQVRREHYLMAFDGPKVVGYLGWALLDSATAHRFARTLQTPDAEPAADGDVVWLLITAAATPATLKAMLRAGSALYPGKRVMGVRHRANGRVTVLDVPIRAASER